MERINPTRTVRMGRSNIEANRKELIKEIRRRSRGANRRLKNLKKFSQRTGRDLSSSAYGRSKSDLKRLRSSLFGQNLEKKSARSLARELMTLDKFLNSETSTIKGITALDKKLVKSLNDSTGLDIRYSEAGKFFNFINNKLVQDLASLSSAQTFQDVLNAIREGATEEDLKEAYEKYESGEWYADEAFENWAGTNPLLS